MKRRDLIQRLKKECCVLLRSGGNHDVYVNTKNGKKQPVPRHSEIDEHLARHILRYLGLGEQ
ncbi:MAG TPA: type II toxin-antitoxin system HicA family toxin [Deltaproteobacteria bacterium]|nr:type II toxin-antitoxin system HicA family toxin [Deltaproteobacteria bacterium]